MQVAEIVWRLGVSQRNPSLMTIYRLLKRSEAYTRQQLKELQLQKLKETLVFAKKYSPFYSRHFAKAGFDPVIDFNCIADLTKIPAIDKSDLLEYNSDIHTRFSFRRIFKSETSGTSGQVLKFDKDEYWDSFNRASIMRGYSWYGVRMWDRNGYFWGYNIDPRKRVKIRFQDMLQNRFRMFSYEEEEVRRFAAKLKSAVYLSGYSSMIYEVARVINRQQPDTGHYRLKMVKGTSEKIFDTYHSEVKKAFGLKIVSEYGAAESGIIAFECPHGNMHLNMEGVFAEEENGEIVVTNLVARSFPVIRYRLGDYVSFAPGDFVCPCGMAHPVLESVTGRVGKRIQGINNNYPSLTFYYVFKNLALEHQLELNYQAHQQEKGKLTILVEQALTDAHKALIQKEITKYFDTDIVATVKDREVLHHKNGKLIDFISSLD